MKTIVVGDWSGDGHDKTEEFVLDTNEDVKALYAQAVKNLDFDLQKFCEDYEDSYIPEDTLNRVLFILGIKPKDIGIEDYDLEGGNYNLNAWSYFGIWQAMVNSVAFEPIMVVPTTNINIGGYGLFH